MILKLIKHTFLFIILTVITQIGGIVYLLSLFLVRKISEKRSLKFFSVFSILYLITTFLIVPNVAPIFGREKIQESKNVKAHSFFYKLANRNYVKPALNNVIIEVADSFEKKNLGIKLIYLDANFPFINKFPLLPHLSHNDGKKLDITLLYSEAGNLSNKKPSRSGYGVYESPNSKEYNQTNFCKEKGYWQYDFPKYLSLGKINHIIKYSNKANKELMKIIISNKQVEKVFIEPHLKSRMNLSSSKIRFHGCGAVRHDDHIHLQIK